LSIPGREDYIAHLYRTIILKYSQLEEIEEYSRRVKRGLNPSETIILEKYLRPPARVLDVGCGAGRESLALAKMGYEVWGIDLVPEMIERARENALREGVRVNFEVMDASSLGFPQESFDYCVMLSQVIEHIPTRKRRIETLKGVRRVLKKGGILILTTHSRKATGRNRAYWFFNYVVRKIQMGFGFGTLEIGDKFLRRTASIRSKGKAFIHIYTIDEALEDIATSGMELVEYRGAREIREGIGTLPIEKEWIVFYVAQRL
jgi:2-polyprenyl-3-methyl-5-hydroxy-6-metoxy-1,4-benzoquinol methylase